MALTFPRWIAAAVAGVLIILASFFSWEPKPPRERTVRENLIYAEQMASAAATREATRLRISTLRDSVRDVVARMPATDSSRIFSSARIPLIIQRRNDVLATRLNLVRAQERRSPIDIAFIMDTSSRVREAFLNRSRLGTTHVLPSGPGERCTVVVRNQPLTGWSDNGYGRTYWSTYLTSATTAARVLGPCGFYEAFGAPGRGVYEWLGNGAWKFGSLATMRNAPTISLDEDQRYYRWFPLWGYRAGWPLRNYISTAGYRCATGDADACRRIVLDPSSDPQAPERPRISEDRIVPRALAEDREWWSSLGPGESQFLADMARLLGPDKFRAFWTSDKPAAEAFQAAVGQDIGAWTADWARSRYGALPRGPGADARATIFLLLLTLAGLGAAIMTSRRRQMA